jgi:amino acid transporter
MALGQVVDAVLGKPLPSGREEAERVGPAAGVAILGLDALASAAYGPEAALTALLPMGAQAPGRLAPVMLPIVALLLILAISYAQTIAAYPSGGGAFTVAKDNLGWRAALLAAGALALDYILNVAVAISAGVGALVSVVPTLLPHTLPLTLLVLLLIALVNLRGVRDVGVAWSAPTWLFVIAMLATLTTGTIRTVLSGGHPHALVPPPAPPAATAGLSLWLLLRAFANGCTAMTGVEAVSNGVPIFRDPTIANARRTLWAIVTLLAIMLVGLSLLAPTYGIAATAPGQPGYRSVLSQLFAAVLGRGPLYHLAMLALLMVLVLSANTSFAGFPRLCRALAQEGFLPEEFAHRGRRLVYSRGILILAIIAAGLLLAFGGVTDRLIPLFAVGALGAFTLSQAAMVMHWWHKRGRGWRRSMVLNGTGAVATATTLVVVAVSKLAEGAWVSLLIVAALVTLFARVRRYQQSLAARVDHPGPVDFAGGEPPLVIVPLSNLDRVADKALHFAARISPDVEAVNVASGEGPRGHLTDRWPDLVEAPARRAQRPVPRLVVLPSEYRQFVAPLVEHVLEQARSGREVIVLVPELVPRRWYHHLLKGHRATLLRAALLLQANPRIVVASAPWYEEPEG